MRHSKNIIFFNGSEYIQESRYPDFWIPTNGEIRPRTGVQAPDPYPPFTRCIRKTSAPSGTSANRSPVMISPSTATETPAAM